MQVVFKLCLFSTLIISTIHLREVNATTVKDIYDFYNEPLKGNYLTVNQIVNLNIAKKQAESTIDEVEYTSKLDEVIEFASFEETTLSKVDLTQKTKVLNEDINEFNNLTNPSPTELIRINAKIKHEIEDISDLTLRLINKDKQSKIPVLVTEADDYLVAREKKKLSKLSKQLKDATSSKNITPVSLPFTITDMFSGRNNAHLTSSFGYRMHPITSKLSFHTGVDIGIKGGTPIEFSFNEGTVIDKGYNSVRGNYIEVLVKPSIILKYFHMREGTMLDISSKVKYRDVLGYVGSTGWSTGNHLHLTIQINGNLHDYLKKGSK